MRIATGVDLESTGLLKGANTDQHRIVEIAMILYDLDTHKRIGKYVQRINPQRNITADAQRVHGISIDDVSGSPVWSAVAPTVAKIIAKSDLIFAHNGDAFDFPFIIYELVRVSITPPEVVTFDTMTEARWATPEGKNPTLGELCFALDIPYDPGKAHGAEYDVQVMADCFFKGIDLGFYSIPDNIIYKEAKCA